MEINLMANIAGFINISVHRFLISIFKNYDFKEENEVRFVNPPYTNLTPKYRARNDIKIPYVELEMRKSQKLPIEEIIVGPGFDDYETEKTELTKLLENNGYKVKHGEDDDGIEIKRSKIPYRG
jgi:hypothetical protein